MAGTGFGFSGTSSSSSSPFSFGFSKPISSSAPSFGFGSGTAAASTPAASPFGSSGTAPTSNLFGSSSSGAAPASNLFGAGSGSLFGASTGSATTSVFGFSSSGTGQTSRLFGSTTSSAAPASPSLSPSPFGGTSAVFGSPAPGSSNLFGSAAPSPGLFGSSSSASTSSTGTPLFGSAAPTSSLFGSSPSASTPATTAPAIGSSQAPTVGLFGSSTSTGTVISSASIFGSGLAPSAGIFGSSTSSSSTATAGTTSSSFFLKWSGVPVTGATVSAGSSTSSAAQTSSSLVVASTSGSASTTSAAVATPKLPSEITGRTVEEAMAKPSLSMKLLVDTQTERVLFAEASKDCVDFLLHILALPVATVIALLKKQGMVGSLGKLYDSIENLNDSYLQSNQSKDAILKPLVPNRAGSPFPLLLCNEDASARMKFYCCGGGCRNYFTDDPRALCTYCNRQMTGTMTYVAPPAVQQGSNEGGYVKAVVTYMVMDDLEVKPMSTISSITLLNTFKVKDVGLLEERVVDLDMTQAMNLLKASFQSVCVLTDVFVKGNRAAAN